MISLALVRPRRGALDLASRTRCGIEGSIVVVGGIYRRAFWHGVFYSRLRNHQYHFFFKHPGRTYST